MSKFNFDRVLQNMTAIQKELPTLLANDVQNYSLYAFKKQSYAGTRWAQVQRRIVGTPEYKYPKTKGLARRTKPILVLTGALRREVSNLSSSAKITTSTNDFKVVLRIDSSVIPYAGYLNDGTPNMVARPFLKSNPYLDRIIKNRINTFIDKLWRA